MEGNLPNKQIVRLMSKGHTMGTVVMSALPARSIANIHWAPPVEMEFRDAACAYGPQHVYLSHSLLCTTSDSSLEASLAELQ